MRIELQINLTSRKKTIRDLCVRIARKAAQDMVADMAESFGGTKTGRFYRRGSLKGATSKRAEAGFGAAGFRRARTPDKNGNRRFVVGYQVHQASAPGEAPARDSGALASTIIQIQEREAGLLQVIPVTPYGFILEEKLNRPYIQPARARVIPAIQLAIARVGG